MLLCAQLLSKSRNCSCSVEKPLIGLVHHLLACSTYKADSMFGNVISSSVFHMQKLSHKQLQREATQRLNEFMGQIRNQTSVDVSAKNLGEEGCAYVVEALAFNDR